MAFQPQLNPLGLPLGVNPALVDPNLLAAATQQGLANAALTRLLAASLAGGTGVLNPADQMNVDLSQGPPAANLGGMMDWLGGAAPLTGTPALGSGSAPASGAGPAASGGAGGKGELQGPKDAGPAQGATGEWGPEDEKFLTEAVSKGGGAGPAAGAGGADTSKQFEEIFNDFGQTSEGNCATVAVVKAALDKYGTKMFNSVQKQGDGFQVQQQDGKSVNITSAELKKAAQAAKLKGKPSAAKSMAVLAYAVVGKNSGGVDKLGNGADPKKIAQALGLGNKMKDVSPQEAAQSKDGAVAWNNTHAVYQANGKTDAYGKEQQANGTAAGRGQLTKAFVFV